MDYSKESEQLQVYARTQVLMERWLREHDARLIREVVIPIVMAEGDIPTVGGGSLTRWDACDNVRRELERRAAEILEGK